MQQRGALKGNQETYPGSTALQCLVWAVTEDVCKILPRGADLTLHNPFLHLSHLRESLIGPVRYVEPNNFTVKQNMHLHRILLSLSCTNTCSHKDTHFMAIPGIFKACFFIALRGSWGLAEKGREVLWPMWNSTACISLFTPARTHTPTHRHTHTLYLLRTAHSQLWKLLGNRSCILVSFNMFILHVKYVTYLCCFLTLYVCACLCVYVPQVNLVLPLIKDGYI